MCHMTLDQQETGRSTGRSVSQSAGVYRLGSHMWLLSGDVRAETFDCPHADLLGKNKRSESKESGQSRRSITQARSLIRNRRCQKWRIAIPQSVWYQVGAATRRPSLQHLTE